MMNLSDWLMMMQRDSPGPSQRLPPVIEQLTGIIGILFVKENIHKLEDENEEHMPIGYEVALPSLIEIAKKLDIDIPENTPGLQSIYARREIPRSTLHKEPTTLLHTLEGMSGLEWEKLLKFRCADGSFLFSPSSTAFALQETKDPNCLKYLENCVRQFEGGVPNVYPVDMLCGAVTQAVTGMYNLYRSSQLMYASLPRVEARFYLEQYGGEDDVWIGKTFYRMPKVSNNTYLELGKLDYNNCQAMHRREWENIQKWYKSCGLEEFGSSERTLLQCYYIASASLFEPEKRVERIAWTKTAFITNTIVSYFDQQGLSKEQKYDFVNEFKDASGILNYPYGGSYKTQCRLLGTLVTTVNQLSLDILLAHGLDIRPQLNHMWHKWLKKWKEEEGVGEGDVEALDG